MSNRFKKLIQDSKELPSLSAKYDSPKLHHDLNQLSAETNLINSNIDTSFKDNSAMGHYFLAQGGANTHDNSQYLKDIDTRFTFQPTQMIRKTNVEAHLKQVQETYMKETVDESRRKTRQTVLDSMNEQRNDYWRSRKHLILQEWDLEEDNKSFGQLGTSKNTQIINNQKKEYAATVKNLNDKRVIEQSIPIVDMFAQLSKSVTCTSTQRSSMNDSWDIIASLTGEKSDRIYGAYINDTYDQFKVFDMKQRLIKTARSYLESQFQFNVNETLRKNAAAATVGGSLSKKHRLKAYMKLQYKGSKGSTWANPVLEVHDDTPIWLFVFLLIRCGYYNLALEFVEDKPQHFSNAPEFCAIFREFCTSTNFDVSNASRIIIDQRYRSLKYSNLACDPYKLLLYKIIGRCELQNKSEGIITMVEDSLWLQLMLVREIPKELDPGRREYHLSEFQDIVYQADHAKYDKDGLNPWFYFNMLLLSLQFEKAINYLHSFEEFRIQAVHLAIVFVYYGVVRIPSKPNSDIYDILVSNPDGSTCLNYSGLISQYIRSFSPDQCQVTLQYLYLLTLHPTREMYSVCHKKVVQQIVQCSNFKEILGGNIGSVGLIDKYKPLLGFQPYDNNYKDRIIIPVARIFQNLGRYKDSVYVFELVGGYKEAIGVLNQEIYRILNNYYSADRKEPIAVAMQDLSVFCAAYNRYYHNLQDLNIIKTHEILLNFMLATLEDYKKNIDKATEYVEHTNVLPVSTDLHKVNSHIESFQTLHDYVRNLVPYMILIALEKKSNCTPISRFLTMGNLQMPASLRKRINQKLAEINLE